MKDSLDNNQVFHTFTQDNLNKTKCNTELTSLTTNCYVPNYPLPVVRERKLFPKTTSADHTANICKPKSYSTSIKKKCDRRDRLYVFDSSLPLSANTKCENNVSDNRGPISVHERESNPGVLNSPRNSDISVSSNDTTGLSPFVSDWYQSSGSDSNPEPNPIQVSDVTECKPSELADYLRNDVNMADPDYLPVISCACSSTSPLHTQRNRKTTVIEIEPERDEHSEEPTHVDYSARDVPSGFTPISFPAPSHIPLTMESSSFPAPSHIPSTMESPSFPAPSHIPLTMESPSIPQQSNSHSPQMLSSPKATGSSPGHVPTPGHSGFNFNYQMLLKRKCSNEHDGGMRPICEPFDNCMDKYVGECGSSEFPGEGDPPMSVSENTCSALQHSYMVPPHVATGFPYYNPACSSIAIDEYGSLSSIVAGMDLQVECSAVPTGAADELADVMGIHSSDGLSADSPISSMDGGSASGLPLSEPTRGGLQEIPCSVGTDRTAQSQPLSPQAPTPPPRAESFCVSPVTPRPPPRAHSYHVSPMAPQPPTPPQRDTIVFTNLQGNCINSYSLGDW